MPLPALRTPAVRASLSRKAADPAPPADLSADDLYLFVSRFIKLIGIAKVAAVVALCDYCSAYYTQKPQILQQIQADELIKIQFINEFITGI